MNVRRRLILGLTIGLGGAFLSSLAGGLLTWQSHHRGWGGLIINPPRSATVRASAPGKPMVGPYKPRTVMLTIPGGPADRSGLRIGDLVVSINGVDFRDANGLAALDAKIRSGDVVTYTIERDGKHLAIPVHFDSPFRSPLTLLQTLVAAVVGFTFLVIGAFVFSRKPDDRRVFIFYILTMVYGISMIGLAGGAAGAATWRGLSWEQGIDLVVLIVISLIAVASVPLTLHLALIFPKERPIVQTMPRVLRWVYGTPILVFVASAVVALAMSAHSVMRKGPDAQLMKVVVGTSSALALLGALAAIVAILRRRETTRFRAFATRPVSTMALHLILFVSVALILSALDFRKTSFAIVCFAAGVPMLALIFMPVVSCVALYRSYREANVEERRQVVWPLWGLIIALGGRILVTLVSGAIGAYLGATHDDMQSYMEPAQYFDLVSRALLVLIPISFAFAILKYRLMNIDVIIRKTVVYTILTGAIIVLYVVLVGGFGTLLLNLTGTTNQTIVIASTLVVALVFVPLRNKLQTLVERNLFRHKYEYPDALKAIGADALAATELAPFLYSASEKIQQALQNRSVVMFVLRHGEHVATAKVGVADTILGTLRVADASMHEALDRPFDPRRRTLPDDAAAAMRQIEAVLVVPINTPGTPANGFLTLGSKLSGGELDVEDIDFLRSVADQIDIGMDRIRQQRDEADFAQARSIQQALLPREMPRVAGLDVSGIWQPARDMGGDYYDLLKLSDSELAVCIGDVAGKGMPAALLMSGLQASVRVSAFEHSSPRELCERVRRVVVSSLSGGRFVTFFYAVIDTATMRIRWCNAGHNASILARADGSIVRLDAGGPAMSRLTRGQSYAEAEAELRPGDRIVLFTDGVSEARDGRGEMFGEPRLEELVASAPAATARDLQQTIVDAVMGYSRGEPEDDVTLVVVKV